MLFDISKDRIVFHYWSIGVICKCMIAVKFTTDLRQTALYLFIYKHVHANTPYHGGLRWSRSDFLDNVYKLTLI